MRALTAASCASGCSTRPKALMSVLSNAVRTSATCTPAAVISDGLSSKVVPGCVPCAEVEAATGCRDEAGGAAVPAETVVKKCNPPALSSPRASTAASVPAPAPSAINFFSLEVICFSNLCWVGLGSKYLYRKSLYWIGQAPRPLSRVSERRRCVPTPPHRHPWPTMPCSRQLECQEEGSGYR